MNSFKILFVLLLSIFPITGISQEDLKNLDLQLENYEYPFPVNYFEFKAQQQNLEMGYILEKPKNFNGQTILLLHGKNFNAAYWESTINSLKEEGYQVLAPDQIGFGKSTKPDYFQYTFQQLAENTKALLDEVQINKVSILGHSMGGMLATRFALMYPEHTQNLILVNPIGLEDWKVKIPYQSVDDWYKSELEKDYEAIKKYQQENYYDGKWTEDFAKWAKLLAGWTLNEDYEKIAWNAALTYDMVLTQPVVYEFKHLEVPTLLIIGTRDRTALGKNLVDQEIAETMGRYNQLGKIAANDIPDAKLVEIENVGHLPHIEAFSEFITPLLDYLKK